MEWYTSSEVHDRKMWHNGTEKVSSSVRWMMEEVGHCGRWWGPKEWGRKERKLLGGGRPRCCDIGLRDGERIFNFDISRLYLDEGGKGNDLFRLGKLQ